MPLVVLLHVSTVFHKQSFEDTGVQADYMYLAMHSTGYLCIVFVLGTVNMCYMESRSGHNSEVNVYAEILSRDHVKCSL